MPHPLSRTVPMTRWPQDLREAWIATSRSGSLLRQRGPAAAWSQPTKIFVTSAIGNFHFWLRQTNQTSAGLPYVDLVTPDRVTAYAAARRAEIRDVSVRSRLVGLVRGMTVLYPERDWSWIRRIIAGIPDGRAASRRRKQPRIRHSLELFDLGLQLTQQAEQDTVHGAIDRAILFRDGLIVALLALRPIRRKNLAGLVIGVHVFKTSTGWRLFLPAAEVKNREEYDKDVPAEVGTMLDRYLAAYRPILLATRSEPAELERPYLWISSTGKLLQPDRIWKQVCAHTAKAFGKSVPPHFFRDCAMTTWALDLPTKVRGGIHVLGNRSFAVAESAYNMAGSSTAAAKLQGALVAVRRASKPSVKHRCRVRVPPNDRS